MAAGEGVSWCKLEGEESGNGGKSNERKTKRGIGFPPMTPLVYGLCSKWE